MLKKLNFLIGAWPQMLSLVPIVYDENDAATNIIELVKNPEHATSVFCINENVWQTHDPNAPNGKGTAQLRHLSYQRHPDKVSGPLVAGVPVSWSPLTGGFSELGPAEKMAIDASINDLVKALRKRPDLKRIVYAANPLDTLSWDSRPTPATPRSSPTRPNRFTSCRFASPLLKTRTRTRT